MTARLLRVVIAWLLVAVIAVYNPDCLRAIADFCATLTKEHSS